MPEPNGNGNGQRNSRGGRGRPPNGRGISPFLPAYTDARRRRTSRRRRARQTRRIVALVIVLLLVALAAAATLGAFATTTAFRASCSLDSVPIINELGQNSRVYDKNGDLLGLIRAEQNRQVVSFTEISPQLRAATVAIEDRRFYEHPGIDYEGILRAAISNVEAGKVRQGGSTITQQLVRNLFIGSDVSFNRKVKEACLALKLDEAWEKDEILDQYLNTVYYGNRAYGVEAAAQTYFGRPSGELTLAEAAMIAGLPQAPSAADPFSQGETALRRRNDVLLAMLDSGYISQERYEKAAGTDLVLKPGGLFVDQKEPLFFNFVRDQLVAEYGVNIVRNGGLQVFTTIDRELQRKAEEAILNRLNIEGDPAASIVSIDPATGFIRAMVQAQTGVGSSQFNLATQGRRQAGSSFKTYVLVEAVRRGINPDSTIYVSAPFTYQPVPTAAAWSPKTYSGSYAGRVSITRATVSSDNAVYARLTLDLGPEAVAKTARRMGVNRSELKPVASIGLGSNDVSVLEMASAYATLAAGGRYSQPTAIRRVVLANGEVDRQAGWGKPKQKQVLKDGEAAVVTRILQQNVQGGTGTRARLDGWSAAGKTGTTDDHTDAWFVGYTPVLSTAVWVGHPKSTTERMLSVHGTRVAGGTFPAEIWGDFMREALDGRSPVAFRPPKQLPQWSPWVGQYQLVGDEEEEEEEEEPGIGGKDDPKAPPPPKLKDKPPADENAPAPPGKDDPAPPADAPPDPAPAPPAEPPPPATPPAT